MPQKSDDVATDPIYSLAIELTHFILGEEDRAMEQMQAGGPLLSDNQRKQRLYAEITAKIKAVIPE